MKRHIKLLAVILAVALLAGGLLPTLFVGAKQDRVEGTAELEFVDTRTKEANPLAFRNPYDGTNANMTIDTEDGLALASMGTIESIFTTSADEVVTQYPEWVAKAWAQGNYYIAAVSLTTEYQVAPENNGGTPNFNSMWTMTFDDLPDGIDLTKGSWVLMQSDLDSNYTTNGAFAIKGLQVDGVLDPVIGEVQDEFGATGVQSDSVSFFINPQKVIPRHLMLFLVVELPVVETEPSAEPSTDASVDFQPSYQLVLCKPKQQNYFAE